MAKQIVTLGNKVVAHGEDCFLSMGGTVICKNTGRSFVNATVTNCSCEIPSDIDKVGYEYHAGAFVPDGSLPYNTFFNGGLPVPARIVYGTYTGSLKYGKDNPNTLSFDFAPLLVCVFSNDAYPGAGSTSKADSLERQLIMCRGVTEQPCIRQSGTEYFVTGGARKITWGDNSVTWYTTTDSSYDQWNGYQCTYHYIAIG